MHGTINIKFIIHYNSLFIEVLTEQPEGQSQSQQQYTQTYKHTHTHKHTNKKEHKNDRPKDKNSTNLTKIPDLFYNIVTIIPYMHIHHN